MTAPLRIDFGELDRRLEDIEGLLPKGQYELTLVVRYVGREKRDADMVLTRDDLNAVANVIEQYKNRPPRYNIGDIVK